MSEIGIDAKVSKLGQEEKKLLRVIILLQSTKYAWGDLADTINQPANQLRLLEANFGNLARTIGSLFLPIVTKVLPHFNARAIALQHLFSWIGSILGIKMSGFGTSIGSAPADWGDMEEAAGEAVTTASALMVAAAALAVGLGYVFATNEDVRTSFFNAAKVIGGNFMSAFQEISEIVVPAISNGFKT